MLAWLLVLMLNVPEGEIMSKRIVVLPFATDPSANEPLEGMALCLALHGAAQDSKRLVPLTAVRKKLNEYGLSLISPLSLASRIKLARDLNADLLVYGHLSGEELRVSQMAMEEMSLDGSVYGRPSDAGADSLLSPLADMLHLGLKDDHPFDLYRLWASAYYVEDADRVQETMLRLLQHQATGWVFAEEYLDLFGEPIGDEATLQEKSYWRDLLLSKGHGSSALALSESLMDARHNPGDFLAHAAILAETGDLTSACEWLTKAASFGFKPPRESKLPGLCDEAAKAH